MKRAFYPALICGVMVCAGMTARAADNAPVYEPVFPLGYGHHNTNNNNNTGYGLTGNADSTVTTEDSKGNVTTTRTKHERDGDWETRRITVAPDGRTSETVTRAKLDRDGNADIDTIVISPDDKTAKKTPAADAAQNSTPSERPVVYLDESGEATAYKKDGKIYIVNPAGEKPSDALPRSFGGAAEFND